jgi:hypothetical protein
MSSEIVLALPLNSSVILQISDAIKLKEVEQWIKNVIGNECSCHLLRPFGQLESVSI